MRRGINTIPKKEYSQLLWEAASRMKVKIKKLIELEDSLKRHCDDIEDYEKAEKHDFNSRALLIAIQAITKSPNEFEDWHDCNNSDDIPQNTEWCLLRVEYVCDGETVVDYLTSSWNFGWTGDYLDKIADNYEDYKITHWRYINRPKGVEL